MIGEYVTRSYPVRAWKYEGGDVGELLAYLNGFARVSTLHNHPHRFVASYAQAGWGGIPTQASIALDCANNDTVMVRKGEWLVIKLEPSGQLGVTVVPGHLFEQVFLPQDLTQHTSAQDAASYAEGYAKGILDAQVGKI